MKTVTAYLNFNGNCRQAMTFYQQCLGTELELTPFPDAQGKPLADAKAGIMHARLTRGGQAVTDGLGLSSGGVKPWRRQLLRLRGLRDPGRNRADLLSPRQEWAGQNAAQRHALGRAVRDAYRPVRHPLDDQL